MSIPGDKGGDYFEDKLKNQHELEQASINFEKQMVSILNTIEEFIADQLIKGITPTVLLGEFATINDIKKWYFGDVEVDYAKGVVFTFGLKGEDPQEDGIQLMVYRTTDLVYGQVVII